MSEALHLRLEGFEGPLDLLLDLARAQKVDLHCISILQLAEQYLEVVEKVQQDINAFHIEKAADWLVMAAWLAWLKSRLLLPNLDDDDETVESATEALQERLIELEHMRVAAQWLIDKPRLGKNVFERPLAEDHTLIDRSGLRADLSRLVLSYLKVRQRHHRKRAYTPRVMQYWTVQQARAVLVRLLGKERVGGWQCLHVLVPDEETEPVARKAALAGLLIAGLEMAKGGQVELRQDNDFGDIEWRGA